MPPPYGELFSKETLIRSASSKAFAATTEARIGWYTSTKLLNWHMLLDKLFTGSMQALTVTL